MPVPVPLVEVPAVEVPVLDLSGVTGQTPVAGSGVQTSGFFATSAQEGSAAPGVPGTHFGAAPGCPGVPGWPGVPG